MTSHEEMEADKASGGSTGHTVHVSLGVGAQVRRATDLLASRAQCPLWVINGRVGLREKRLL